MPYSILAPVTIVLPIEQKDGVLTVVKSEKLIKDGYREFGKWMEEAEQTWITKRKDKAAKQNLYQRLDYQKELTRQDLQVRRYLVLYNHSGMNVGGCVTTTGGQRADLVHRGRKALLGGLQRPREEAELRRRRS